MKMVFTCTLCVLILSTFCPAQRNLQSFTPSQLFAKGDFEVKTFANFYEQSKAFIDLKKEPLNSRDSYATWLTQLLIGTDKNINYGLEVWGKAVHANRPLSENRPFSNSFNSAPNGRVDLIYVGPKLKWMPFKQKTNFSTQQTLLLPTGRDYEGRESTEKPFLFLEFDRALSITDFFWDQPLGEHWGLFSRVSFWTSFPRNSFRQNVFLETPVSFFLSYFPTPRITFYGQSEAWIKHVRDQFSQGVSNNKFVPFNSFFAHSGLGGKYQVVLNRLELELLYTNFWIGGNGEGAGATYNFGVRYIFQ